MGADVPRPPEAVRPVDGCPEGECGDRAKVQLTTDGFMAYLKAVDEAFGDGIDYAMLVKLYGEAAEPKGRYSPAERIGALSTPARARRPWSTSPRPMWSARTST